MHKNSIYIVWRPPLWSCFIYGTDAIGWENSALDRTSVWFIKFQFYCGRFAALQNWESIYIGCQDGTTVFGFRVKVLNKPLNKNFTSVLLVILPSIKYSNLSKPWKYNNRRNTITFSFSKTFFIFLMTLIDSTNDQNICVELFKAIFTH